MATADPLLHGDGRAATDLGDHLEFVHQPLGTRETEPQAAGRGEAVLQRERDVADARALILGHNDHALPVAVGESRKRISPRLAYIRMLRAISEMAAAITV